MPMFYDKDDMVKFEPGEYMRKMFFSQLHRQLECETFLSLFIV